MIKGVNKQIIEINDPENKFFEKAVLYIRPEYADLPIGKINSSANELISNMSFVNLWCMDQSGPENNKKTVNRRKLLLSLIGTGLILAASVYIILTIV